MQKDCKAILGPLSDYLEGDAGVKMCRRIEKHLAGCKRCRIHVDTMKLIITLYKQWRDEEIPASFSLKLERMIENLNRSSRQPKRMPHRRKRRSR